ncbi:DUF349 domain-containing protein [Gardnerella vaginalis]|uniref:DUF349 domain-containing protein n=1 Tax=Gardnerella vaginalis TaxID=2702 RepID=A0A133NTQ2_GARVA|nr:DUF349 domain-containing protein [Gardnerella vaginalis]EPI42403.1 hypothetical protein HMPREF1584_00995 [Gardnerella vaginalis JCP8481A]EPI44271.1 hypothetical protein HMPREF1585_00151 [Gardnerella vaginalis JCP8481B]KXA19672.1 hypothetical protein HMPREF3208_01020 [Gardnerella vaginalis]
MTEQTKPEETIQSNATPKPHVPSPASFAHKARVVAQAPTISYSEEDIKSAQNFGRVDENGTVYVRENGAEREVGQYSTGTPEEALTFYIHRYLDLKIKLDLFAKRLESSNVKAKEIDETLHALQTELENPAAVGDLAALRARHAELKAKGDEKKEALAKARKEALEKALKERANIVERAEALVAHMSESTNWRELNDKLRALFDEWQEHQRTTIHLNKADADALWQRFSKARSAFSQARNSWVKEREHVRNNAKQLKEAIIAEAEALKSSTDWRETSMKFNALMDRWKKAGNAGRQHDDALWTKFREAADAFYHARQADREKMNAGEHENLAKKEALLAKAEALLPVENEEAAKKARKALSAIQEEWDAIGYVPREDMRRIETRLNDVDKKIKAVEEAAWRDADPEANARKSSFASQLQAQLDELDAAIAKESDAKRKAKLEAEKATKEQWLNAIK